MNKALKALGISAVSLSLAIGLIGCKKNTTTKDNKTTITKNNTTNNKTSSTTNNITTKKVTTNNATTKKVTTKKETTKKDTTTKKRTSVRTTEFNEYRSLGIQNFENVSVKVTDADNNEYVNNDSIKVFSTLSFELKNDNSYDVLIDFNDKDNSPMESVLLSASNTKTIDIFVDRDIFIKTKKVEKEDEYYLISLPSSFDVIRERYCMSKNDDETYSKKFIENYGIYPKGSLVTLVLYNSESYYVDVTVKMGDTVILEKELKTFEEVSLNDLELTGDLTLTVKRIDEVYIDMDNYDGDWRMDFSAYYFDEEGNKVDKDESFYVKAGTRIYFKVHPYVADTLIATIKKEGIYDDYRFVEIVEGEALEEKEFCGGEGIIADTGLSANYSWPDTEHIDFTTEVEGVTLEIYDLAYLEVLDNMHIPYGSHIECRIKNNSGNKVIALIGNTRFGRGYVIDSAVTSFDRFVTCSDEIHILPYFEHDLDIEIPEVEGLKVEPYYVDIWGNKHIIEGNSIFTRRMNFEYSAINNTDKLALVTITDDKGNVVSEETINPGVQTVIRYLDNAYTNLLFKVELIGYPLHFEKINMDIAIGASLSIPGVDSIISDFRGDIYVPVNQEINIYFDFDPFTTFLYKVSEQSGNVIAQDTVDTHDISDMDMKITLFAGMKITVYRIDNFGQSAMLNFENDDYLGVEVYFKNYDSDSFEGPTWSPDYEIGKIIQIKIFNDYDESYNVYLEYNESKYFYATVPAGEDVTIEFMISNDTTVSIVAVE